MKREYNLDLLRVLCCFLVVFMHFASYPYNVSPVNSIGWYSSMTLNYFGKIAVPIFFMLSGYFLLNVNKMITYKYLMKKIINIIIAYLFWLFIYFIWKHQLYILSNIQLSVSFFKVLLQELITAQPHFWFINSLLGLYLLLPIYRKIVAKPKLTKYYIAVFFIIFFIIRPLSFLYPIGLIYDFINSIGFSKLFGFSIYFIVGGIIKKTRFIKYTKLLSFMGASSILFMIISNIIYSYIYSIKGQFLCDYMQPFAFVGALAVFVYFLNLNILNYKIKKIVAYFSNLTMGIYYLPILGKCIS